MTELVYDGQNVALIAARRDQHIGGVNVVQIGGVGAFKLVAAAAHVVHLVLAHKLHYLGEGVVHVGNAVFDGLEGTLRTHGADVVSVVEAAVLDRRLVQGDHVLLYRIDIALGVLGGVVTSEVLVCHFVVGFVAELVGKLPVELYEVNVYLGCLGVEFVPLIRVTDRDLRHLGGKLVVAGLQLAFLLVKLNDLVGVFAD